MVQDRQRTLAHHGIRLFLCQLQGLIELSVVVKRPGQHAAAAQPVGAEHQGLAVGCLGLVEPPADQVRPAEIEGDD